MLSLQRSVPAMLPVCAAIAALSPSAFAQEVEGDGDLEALRRAAEQELAADEAPPADEGEALRRSAALETEDETPIYQQLQQAFSAVANRLNSFNPRITVIGDALARLSLGSAELVENPGTPDEVRVDDRMSLREVELDFRADVDAYAKAVFILALEEEGGEYLATVEEGYVTLETLPFGFRAQLGRFRTPFGRMNRLHGHDLPQATEPLALTDIFGEEGYLDNGALLSWLAPVPLELTVGFLQGDNQPVLGTSDLDSPAWLGRAEYFLQISDTIFLSAGASYLYGLNDTPDPADQESHVYGADLLFKWQPNQFRSIVVQGEVYGIKQETPITGDPMWGFGGYAYLQVQPFQRWYLGVRYDWSNFDEHREDREQYAVSGWLSYYTTEFLRFRVGYEHRERESTAGGDPDLDTFFFQLTFVFGSHPVEPFWFNR